MFNSLASVELHPPVYDQTHATRPLVLRLPVPGVVLELVSCKLVSFAMVITAKKVGLYRQTWHPGLPQLR